MTKSNIIKCMSLLLALLFMPLATQAAEDDTYEQQFLCITSGADTTSFALRDKPVITVSGNSLVVKSLGDSLIVNLAGTKYFFETRTVKKPTTGINSVTIPGTGNGSAQPAFAQGAVTGLKAGAEVRIYQISGTLVKHVKADDRGRATLDLSSLPRGIYIVRTPTNSIKIINR